MPTQELEAKAGVVVDSTATPAEVDAKEKPKPEKRGRAEPAEAKSTAPAETESSAKPEKCEPAEAKEDADDPEDEKPEPSATPVEAEASDDKDGGDKDTGGKARRPPPQKDPSQDTEKKRKKRTKYKNKADSINNLYNIDAENVTMSGAEKPETKLDDLLRDLRGKSRSLPKMDLSREPSAPATQPDDPLLFVTCHYHDVALSAAHALIETRFERHSRHFLDISFADETVEILERIEETPSEPRVVLIEITRETHFLTSLKSAGRTKIDSVKAVLRDHKTTLICVSTDRLLEDDLDETILSKEEVHHWSIQFLFYVLSQEFGTEEAARLIRDVDQQRSQNRWPQDDADLYEEIRSYWKAGAEELRTQIEMRQTQEGFIEAQPIRAEDIFPKERSVGQLAMCTAVYFRDLTPRDFEIILGKVLEDEEAEIEKTEEVVKKDGEVATTKDGEVITTKKKIPRKLKEIWSEAPDAILQRCHLVQIKTGDGGRAIEFDQPYLRTQTRNLIDKRYPMLVTQFFDKLQTQGLLFDPELSVDITQNLVRLAVERTLDDPTYYDERWLMQSVMGIKALVSVQLEATEDPDVYFYNFLESIRSMGIWTHFCQRLSDVIREMLKHPALEKVVNKFLQNLLRQHDHAAALDIVLHITGNLRFVRGFDSLYWMRRLLDEGGEDVRSRTYTILHQLAMSSGGRVYDFLAGIHDWLPDGTRKPENYSPSQVLALQFIMVFTLNTAHGYRAERYGQWPNRYILFKGLGEDQEKAAAHLDMILSWMHHPGMPEVIRDDVEDRKLAHERNVADVVELWSWILEGPDPRAASEPAAVAMMDQIFASLTRHTDPGDQRVIQKRWYEKQRSYLSQLNDTPRSDRAKRAEHAARRLKVMDLGRRLKTHGHAATAN